MNSFILKRVRYDYSNTQLEVVYLIIGSFVFYTATSFFRLNTEKLATEVIGAICKAERLNWREYRFFDIQTEVGWPEGGAGYLTIREELPTQLSDNSSEFSVWGSYLVVYPRKGERACGEGYKDIFQPPAGVTETFQMVVSQLKSRKAIPGLI